MSTFTRIRAGRYADRPDRWEGRWAIAERVVVDEWSRVDAVPIGWGPEQYRFGTGDASDPVYAIRRRRVARDQLSGPAQVGVATL